MLFTLLDTGVARIVIDRVFLAMQQFRNLGDLGYIRRRVVNMVDQPRLHFRSDMRLHPKEILVTFLCQDHVFRPRSWSNWARE